ncbi:MAG: GtrA family protein [Clostridium sp.]|uniref:GtrA family protein n=1 Tax=Clostridium sp. TaxID=1506 RepID=UPI0025BC156F|nr:GtrA family protein [Clostridium sp.]MCH3965829.1 GtrA family protein [Clostridium sp.]MCI1716082.1 GtrA family protein [Clostridium sp.]MCI1800246.1 GtrA family protein [Clostridium sp.]MCI1814259.1 GtrA family protein [Clostridium sp.]MCI1871158.1 GtrA family protein [Clostridium sp.]
MNSLTKTMDFIFNGRLKLLSRFSATGILNTLIDFIVFTICQSIIGLYYTISQIIGYSFGIANSFIFNKKWTFEAGNSRKKLYYELFQFTVVNIISLSVTLVFMKILISNFNSNIYLAKIIVTLMAQAVNFILYKIWVFN